MNKKNVNENVLELKKVVIINITNSKAQMLVATKDRSRRWKIWKND